MQTRIIRSTWSLRLRCSPGSRLAELPAVPAAPGDSRPHLPCRGRPDLPVQARSRRQARRGSSREPIATLLLDGNTVGRHYAGPRWEHVDGSAVQAKVVSMAPGATVNDIPWLELGVTLQLGHGVLSGVTGVRRINTEGGMAHGRCDTADAFLSVPYRADYVFLR